MERNKELLLKAADRIEKFPLSYSQMTFCRQVDVTEDTPCGTVACLAGEIVIASYDDIVEGARSLIMNSGIAIADSARRLAGFTHHEASDLFGMTGVLWPEPFRTRYFSASYDQVEQAKVAADMLRYLADGGEVNNDEE